MGIFNTYLIDCPWCKRENNRQTKPGDMKTYFFGDDPVDDLKFQGFYECDHCDKSFTVEMESVPKMIIKKYETT